MWIAVDRFVAVVLSRLRALAIVSTWIFSQAGVLFRINLYASKLSEIQ